MKTPDLLDIAFNELDVYRQENGAWYDSSRSVRTFEQVSGAMKVLNGFMAAERLNYGLEKMLID